MNRRRVSALAGIGLGCFLPACGLFHTLSPEPRFEEVGGCSHENLLPLLELTDAHRQLLADRSDPPRTAADYYLALPDSFFGNVEDTSPERRVSFIDMESLDDQWLQASHYFDCDGGGFGLTLRIFGTEAGPVLGIGRALQPAEVIHQNRDAARGELSVIKVVCPGFWRHADGKWSPAEDLVLPVIDAQRVIDRYRSYYQGQLKTPDQEKFIWLEYELPKSGDEIRLTGRENFMDPDGDYVWQVLRFDGKGFVEEPLAD